MTYDPEILREIAADCLKRHRPQLILIQDVTKRLDLSSKGAGK